MRRAVQQLRVVWCALAAVALTGCAAHRHRPPTSGAAVTSLEAFMAQVREATLAARPARANEALTIEKRDPELMAARLALAVSPTADSHRRVAEAYARLGIRDAAYDHFTIAVGLNPRDASAYDGLARIWRDWGLPGRGLSSAYHALYFAPDSPVVYNTLGTLLVNLGQPTAARGAFQRALDRQPGAAYALNNLCYATVLEGDRVQAIDRCRAAIAADPASTTAHNNLALAYAAAGDLASASQEFRQSGDAGTERYNMGVALMAIGRYEEAAAAFEQAAALRPWLTLARERAEQARALGAAAPHP